jgi:hypothetical protein
MNARTPPYTAEYCPLLGRIYAYSFTVAYLTPTALREEKNFFSRRAACFV